MSFKIFILLHQSVFVLPDHLDQNFIQFLKSVHLRDPGTGTVFIVLLHEAYIMQTHLTILNMLCKLITG